MAKAVHLLEWPELPAVGAMSDGWDALRDLRETVMEAIEPLRREKTIRSGLEAEITVPANAHSGRLPTADLAELFITASVTHGDSVTVTPTDNHKCGRCWRLLARSGGRRRAVRRCDDAIDALDAGEGVGGMSAPDPNFGQCQIAP